MSDVEIGRHAEAIDTLKTEVAFLRADVGEIKDMLAEDRAGRKLVVKVGTAAASIGGTIAGVVAWLVSHTA